MSDIVIEKGWFKQLTKVQKAVTVIATLLSAILAIGGTVWAGASVVATDREVDQKIAVVESKFDAYAAQQEKNDLAKEVRDTKIRLEDIEYRLLDPGLPSIQRAALDQAKTKALRKIQCIQASQTFCE